MSRLSLFYPYQHKPLIPDEANHLASACATQQERLIISTLRDTGLRVAELAGLTRDQIDWQNHRLMIYGKGGPYGTRVVFQKWRSTEIDVTLGLMVIAS